MPPNTSVSSLRSEDQSVVELRNVNVIHKSRAGGLFHPNTVHVVNDVSLDVKHRETLGLVGESGCGKSITVRVMVGLQPVISGEIIFKGCPLGRPASDRRDLGRSISVILQGPATILNLYMIAYDVLIGLLNVHGIESPKEHEAKVCDLPHLVGLPPSTLSVLPRQISGNRRQRVAVVRALTLDPDIIVADEPTSALDISMRTQVLNLLQGLKASLGLRLMFISHDIDTVCYVSDRIAVTYFGKTLELNITEEISNNPQEGYTRTLLSAMSSLLDV